MRVLVIAVLSAAAVWNARLSAERLRSPERFALRRYEGLAVHRDEGLALQRFAVRLDTTKGPIVIAVHRDWAPNGADRFHELVVSHYFDDSRFFRVVKGQWAQFGINRDPGIATAWRARTIPDDPRKQSNTRGRVAFAFALPDGRT